MSTEQVTVQSSQSKKCVKEIKLRLLKKYKLDVRKQLKTRENKEKIHPRNITDEGAAVRM